MWSGIAVLIFGGGLLWVQAAGRAALPYGPIIPAFTLTERSGRAVTQNDLLGKIWIADFIYTECPGPCPMMTGAMAKLQERISTLPDVRLVSISVDPKTDTPATLASYAERFGAQEEKWLFLTGGMDEIRRIALEGFLLGFGENSEGAASKDGRWIHSTRFVLVDQSARIRGYYDGLDEKSVNKLVKDISYLSGR